MYNLLKPLLFRLDAEVAHDLVTRLLAYSNRLPQVQRLLHSLLAFQHPMLNTTLAGMAFANPVGLAAGFDKRGVLVRSMAMLGFGHIEVGTVTPRPQPGNPRPRMFRLPEDQALINRLGFNSPGMLVVARELRKERTASIILGINIGKNRDTPLEQAGDDYVAAFLALAPLAQYVTINISSPNTPGLRMLQERQALTNLLAELQYYNQQLPQPRPLLLKISPDETPTQIEMIVATAQAHNMAGLIVGNTTVQRQGLQSAAQSETGGLSGRPLQRQATALIAHAYRSSAGHLPIIGVGGVASATAAYAHLCAGASLVQLYTGLVYAGPQIVTKINQGLVQLLRRDGFSQLKEAIGVTHREHIV